MCKKMMGKTMEMCKSNNSDNNIMSEMMCCDKDMINMNKENMSDMKSSIHMNHHQK